MSPHLSQTTIERIADETGVATALETIRWAVETMGERVCVLTSMQDALLIDLAMRVRPDIDVVFIDTGYHFPETHDTLRAIENRYGIEVDVVGPLEPISPDIEPGACCATKVDLLDAALSDRDGWISGISRVQTSERQDTSLVEIDRRGKLKVNPLAQWNDRDRSCYIARHRLIEHPLRALGYRSIGCAPCTTVPNGADPRSGRWAGTERTECGLHL